MFKTMTKNQFGDSGILEMKSRRTRQWHCAVAATAVLIAGQVAGAAHIVEFQLQSTKLIQLVEHRLLEEEICATSSFELPGQNGDFILDHSEFPGAVTIQRSGQQIQFVAPGGQAQPG